MKLRFTEVALSAVARKAFTQKTGARGLRAILEEAMLDVMYDAPSQKQIKEVVITEDAISGKHAPIRIFETKTSKAPNTLQLLTYLSDFRNGKGASAPFFMPFAVQLHLSFF